MAEITVDELSAGWSNEARALLKPHGTLHIPIPAYGGRSLSNLAASVFRASVLRAQVDDLNPPLTADLDPFPEGRAPGPVVVFLIDGLGWFAYARWLASGSGERAKSFPGRSRPLTTVFPTTTTSALVSLATGTAPAQHGLVGYRQYLPRYRAVVDMLKMMPVGSTKVDSLVDADWRPENFSGQPTLFRRGLDGVALSRDKFQGTGLTRLIYDGAEYVAYGTASDLARLLADLLERPRPPSVIFAYWDELDTIQHLGGPRPEYVQFELDRLAHLLKFAAQRVDPNVARSTTLLVTGDHGQVPTGVQEQMRIDAIPEVASELKYPLAGDRRAGYFAAKPGRHEQLRDALEHRMPAGSRILEMSTALDAGLFGPPPFHPEVRERLGDFLVLLPSPYGVYYVPPGVRPPTRHLYGGHGGLSAEELLVPLISARLIDWA